MCITTANANREEYRQNALKLLGKGLHALQDIDAHMGWDTGNWGINAHTDVNGSTKTFDDPRYDFRLENGKYIPIDSGSEYGSNRFRNTYKNTENWLMQFLRDVY